MAQVKKMMLQGIRSFNPAEDTGQVIEFYSPMTLILGQNGCGKTTIIEALKYAITGQYPPNTKRSFINDPKLSSGFEVKAQVKLEIIDRKAEKVIISRKLKATTKGKQGNVSMNTIESTVSHYKTQPNGSKKKIVDMNSKCFDIQEIINQVIGVRDPILNNVVFVHQEDSCWPLDEASKVKTKFDDIFNTTQYIKALKAFQDREKAMVADIKIAKNNFVHSAETLKEAKKKAEDLEVRKIQLTSMNDKNAEFALELEKVQNETKRLEALQKNFLDQQRVFSEKEGKIKEMDRTIDQFREKITDIFKGDLDALLKQIQKFEFMLEQKEQTLTSLKREKLGEASKRTRIDAKNRAFVTETGIFNDKRDNNEKRVKEMEKLMEDLFAYIRSLKENSQEDSFSVSLNSVLMSFELDSDSVVPSTAVNALDCAIASKEAQQKKLKAKMELEENELNNKLAEFRKSETTITTQIKEKHATELKIKPKIQELVRKLSQLDTSGDIINSLDDQEQLFTDQIERLEKSELTKNFESEIANIQVEIRELEEKRAILLEQSTLLTQDTAKVERIRAANAVKLKKRGECNEIFRRIEPQLRNLLVGDEEKVPEENLLNFLKMKLKILSKEVVEKTDEQTRIGKEIAVMDANKKQVVHELEKKQKEISKINNKAESILEGASFEDEFENTSKETEELQSDVLTNDAAIFLYKEYIKQLTKKPCCPLCKRDFAKEAENKALVADLTKKMKHMEINKPADEKKLEKLKAKKEQLLELKPHWDIKERLENIELPGLRKKKEEYETQLRSAQDKLGELNETLSLLTSEKSSAESLQQDATVFDKSKSDRKQQDVEIQKWEAARDPQAKELTVSLTEVQTEIQSIESTVNARRREKERKEQLRNKKINELNKAKDDRNNVIEQKLKITKDLQNRDAMEQQKKEYETESVVTKASIQELKKKLPDLGASISETETEIAELRKNREDALVSLQKEKTDLVAKKERVNQLHKEIETFGDEAQKYEQDEGKRKECADALAEVDSKIEELTKDIEIISREVNSQAAKKCDLADNKMLKEKEQERVNLNAEIQDALRTIDNARTRGLTAELEGKYKIREDIKKKMNTAEGAMSQVFMQIGNLEGELKDAKYANAEIVHRKFLIKKSVLERVQRDIRLYRASLDSAVMTFHRKKMETINKYLKTYWKKIYKGNDIDYIEIKTENDESAEKTTVKIDMSKSLRKNYNYRVVMNRRGVELDMRGRCSAGQKVLAAIIIRLALAQTFTAHCGIITLDEPTTNLDKLNIESLAETLSELAFSMKDHRTFQLVVITHDQEFIDTLLRIDPIDYYYKVSRDRMGFSQVERISK